MIQHTHINTYKVDTNNIYAIIVPGIIITMLCLFIIFYNRIFNFPSERKKKSKISITIKLLFSYCIQIISIIILQFDDGKNSPFFDFISEFRLSCSLSIISFYLLIVYECYKFSTEEELSLRKEKRLGYICWIVPYLITIGFIPIKIIYKDSVDNIYKIYNIIYCGLFGIIYLLDFIILFLYIKNLLKRNELTFDSLSLVIHNSMIMLIFGIDLFNMIYFIIEGTYFENKYFKLIHVFSDMCVVFLFIHFFKPSFPEFFCNKKSKTMSYALTSNSHSLDSPNDL